MLGALKPKNWFEKPEPSGYFSAMVGLAEIEAQAMELSDKQRAELAASLLGSLPAVLYEEDDGHAEALRRDAEMERDPSMGITAEQLRESLGR